MDYVLKWENDFGKYTAMEVKQGMYRYGFARVITQTLQGRIYEGLFDVFSWLKNSLTTRNSTLYI